jgi:hypothetical protein
MFDTYLAILFISGLVFSLLLYLGDKIPWVLSVISGVFSSLFWWALDLYWVATCPYPELGYLFFLWAVMNLIIMTVVIFGAFAEPENPDQFG